MRSAATSSTGQLSPFDAGLAAAITFFWGINIVAITVVVRDTAPLTAAMLRQCAVMLVCLPFLRIIPGKMKAVLLVGLMQGAAFLVLSNLALRIGHNVSALSIAAQLGVPFALLLGVLFEGERIALVRLFGIVLAFGGVIVMVFDPAAVHEGPGLAVMALGTLMWAIGSLLVRRLGAVPVLTVYGWIGLIGFAVLLPLSLLLEPQAVRHIPALTGQDWGWVLFSAICTTVIGHGGMAWLLQRHPITRVMPLTLGAPVIAVIGSAIAFEIVLTPIVILGAVLSIAGVTIIALRSAEKGRPIEEPVA